MTPEARARTLVNTYTANRTVSRARRMYLEDLVKAALRRERAEALEDAVQENERLRQERDGFANVLRHIQRDYGHVCPEYGTCDHIACRDSSGAWLMADAALKYAEAATPPPAPEAAGREDGEHPLARIAGKYEGPEWEALRGEIAHGRAEEPAWVLQAQSIRLFHSTTYLVTLRDGVFGYHRSPLSIRPDQSEEVGWLETDAAGQVVRWGEGEEGDEDAD